MSRRRIVRLEADNYALRVNATRERIRRETPIEVPRPRRERISGIVLLRATEATEECA